MNKLTAIALSTCCVLASHTASAQTKLNDFQWFDGLSFSLGVASNNSATTTAPGVKESGSSAVTLAKANYTFVSASRLKIGLSASADIQKSNISNGASMSRKFPTEITLEPGYLLSRTTLGYVKLGGYTATYATPFGSQNVHGQASGLGFKSFLTQRTFVQAEWTQHKANGSPAVGWDKFIQTSTAVLVGTQY